MVTKARLENGIVQEVLTADPFPDFPPSLEWVDCPADTEQGWIQINGVVQAPPIQAFSDQQASRIAEVDSVAKEKRDSVVVNTSPGEMASWPIKRAEALAWQSSSSDTDAPNLLREATARQIPLADLVSKVLAKAAQLSSLEADIAGHCGYLQDQLRAATDSTSLYAIDITAGWPI